MSLHRSVFLAVATLCSAGLSSAALANCCGWGNPAPAYHAASGCGSCGVAAYAPITYATPIAEAPIGIGCGACGTPAAVATFAPAPRWGGCGSCGAPTAAATFAAPVAPTPTWGTGCGACGVRTRPAPLYVVNQGPEYTGPGVMVPYRTWVRPAAYVPPPYGPAYYRWHHYGHGYGYRAHAFNHTRYMFRGPYHPGHGWRG